MMTPLENLIVSSIILAAVDKKELVLTTVFVKEAAKIAAKTLVSHGYISKERL